MSSTEIIVVMFFFFSRNLTRKSQRGLNRVNRYIGQDVRLCFPDYLHVCISFVLNSFFFYNTCHFFFFGNIFNSLRITQHSKRYARKMLRNIYFGCWESGEYFQKIFNHSPIYSGTIFYLECHEEATRAERKFSAIALFFFRTTLTHSPQKNHVARWQSSWKIFQFFSPSFEL